MIPFAAQPEPKLFGNLSTDVHIYAVDDSPDTSLSSWPSIARDVCWIASGSRFGMRSAAARNIGHLAAYREGHSVIMALDSDCRPPLGWVDVHMSQVCQETTLAYEDTSGWLNTVVGAYARGLPYEARDPQASAQQRLIESQMVKLNMGTWRGVLDVNAIDRLRGPIPDEPGYSGSAAALSIFPLCGMNVAFSAELLPALFFLPNVEIGNWTLSRHDDIWGGYILQRLMHKRGDLAAFGQPVVEHTQLSNRERALLHEHWMHLLSRGFYACVDEAVTHVKRAGYREMYAEFVPLFRGAVELSREPRHYREVYLKLADYMENWVVAFA